MKRFQYSTLSWNVPKLLPTEAKDQLALYFWMPVISTAWSNLRNKQTCRSLLGEAEKIELQAHSGFFSIEPGS